MDLLSYVLNSINVFNSDRPRHRQLDPKTLAKKAWAWGRKHPEWGTAALVLVALLVLFAWLFW